MVCYVVGLQTILGGSIEKEYLSGCTISIGADMLDLEIFEGGVGRASEKGWPGWPATVQARIPAYKSQILFIKPSSFCQN